MTINSIIDIGLQQSSQYISEIIELNQALNSERNLARLLATILDKAIRFAHAERGFIILGESGQTLGESGQVIMARNFDQEAIQEANFKISRSLAQSVVENGIALITENAQTEAGFEKSNSIQQLQLRSVLCLPLQVWEQRLGVLYLDNRFQSNAFPKSQLPLFQCFADQAALAIHHAQLWENLEKSQAMIYQMEKHFSHSNDRTQKVSMEKFHSPVPKPFSEKILAQAKEMSQEIQVLSGVYHFGKMLSISPLMATLFETCRRAAQSDVSIFIAGASGTGKGMLANSIHHASTRATGPMVAENCAAIPENLLESELFGYAKGAFTGAQENRKGLLDMAENGTLFLDEIAEMSLGMQAKLLRVLESKRIRPIGSNQDHPINIRLISATHADIKMMMEQKKFREDLWYRLQVIYIQIPSLCERPEDIPFLIDYFMSHQTEAQNKHIQIIVPSALEILQSYDWPGNIRQLEHEIMRIVALKKPYEKITVDDISPEIRNNQQTFIPNHLSLKEALKRFEQNYIRHTIDATQGNHSKAAKILGLARRTLYNKINKK